MLAQYAPAPTHLVWWLLLGAFIIGVVAVLAMPEPGTVRPGVVSSLRPHVSVPRAARGAFATAVPALVGIWALAGFYLSLGPSLAAQLLHSKNLLWGGILIFLLTGLGAAASALLARKNPSAVMLGGCLLLIVGALVTFASIETGTAVVLFVGTAIAGLGFGPAFMGAYRATVARGHVRRSGGPDHCDLHRQLPGNWHSGRARWHRYIALRPAQDRACLFGCGRGPGRGRSRQPPDPSDGSRTGAAWNPPCRRRLPGRAQCHRARHSGRAPEKREHERLAAGRPQRPHIPKPHRIRIAPGRSSATKLAVEHQARRPTARIRSTTEVEFLSIAGGRCRHRGHAAHPKQPRRSPRNRSALAARRRTELALNVARERIKRKATAMAIAAATETSFADEVETEPDLELHLRGRSCRCPAANVNRPTGEPIKSAGRSAAPAASSWPTPGGPHRRPA